ncbi:MAG: mandelate racemase/muconate lactonizing enzyme family protein [Caldilineaceae bacterium]|nr:mandelate racemase/muconate lactonizing enzyme family protein [Caldilineaceae bacterium]
MSTEKLTFEKFRVWQVVVPARQDILSTSAGKSAVYTGSVTWPEMPIHLIEGVTSAGFTAIGESGRGTERDVVEATLRDLLGRNLLDFTPATVWLQEFDPVGLPPSYPIYSWHASQGKSYELLEALWLDAVGKAAGLPAHQLLGGAVRKAVPTDFWVNRPEATTLAALVHEASERGLRGMKMKSNLAGDTVHALVAIAADVPHDFRFTLDPMTAWRSMREAARYFEALAKLPFAIQIEDPFPWRAVDDWHKARQIAPLTIACHARDEATLQLSLREGLADTYNLGGGGAYDFLQMAPVVAFGQKDCWQGSSLELGVLQHVRLHAAACARNCVLPSDMQSEWVREHTLITPRMAYADACALVPDRPGLGVELDHEAVKRYTTIAFDVQ